MLPLLAAERDLFSKQGVTAEFIDIQSGKKAMDALRTGDIDLGVLVDSNIAFAGFEGADDLRVVASIQAKADDALIVVSADIPNPADLAGKTIGVTLGTTSHVYLMHFLEAHGMKPSGVTLQNMPPPAIQAGLLNGSLKAGCLWQPFRHNVLTAKPTEYSEWKEPGVYTSQVLLTCTAKYYAAQMATPDNAIVRFLRALIASEGYAAQNTDAAIATLAEKLPVPLDVMRKIWPEYQLRVSLTPELFDLLDKEGRWIAESVTEHQGKARPNYRRFLAVDPLRQVAPDRVKGW